MIHPGKPSQQTVGRWHGDLHTVLHTTDWKQSMWKIFSKRNAGLPDRYRYDIPTSVRSRLLHTFDDLVERAGFQVTLSHVLEGVGKKLVQQYGGLRAAAFEVLSVSTNPVVEHFMACEDELALDFIE